MPGMRLSREYLSGRRRPAAAPITPTAPPVARVLEWPDERPAPQRRHSPDPKVVDELYAEFAAAYPDPVDEFEDALAERLGLRRHPACDLEEWRRTRVEAIDALEDVTAG